MRGSPYLFLLGEGGGGVGGGEEPNSDFELNIQFSLPTNLVKIVTRSQTRIKIVIIIPIFRPNKLENHNYVVRTYLY